MGGFAVAPMDQWSHDAIFLACLLSATLGGFASLLRSETPITGRNFCGYLLWFGLAGMSTSMVGFKWLGGKEQPWMVIGTSTLVGMGVVKTTSLVPFFLKLIKTAASQNDKDDPS